MLQLRSLINVADNTGAKKAATIGVLGQSQKVAREIGRAHV